MYLKPSLNFIYIHILSYINSSATFDQIVGFYVLSQQPWEKRESCSQKRKTQQSPQHCLTTNQSMFGFFPHCSL